MGRPRKRYDGRRTFTCSEVKETSSEGICKGTKAAAEVWQCEEQWLQEFALLHMPYPESQP